MCDLDRRLSVAPMMDWTDRYDRRFLRVISRHTLLYSEMLTTQAIIHGDRERLLGYDFDEHPVACQLGGSNPQDLALCARIVEDYGYDEVNLNVGCPSDRVQSGKFGACLMAYPSLVADCVDAMQAAVSIPVTVKSRIGIDDQDGYESLYTFIETVASGGCQHFIIHARKAILQGLSPRENRTIPPLKYDFAYQVKQDFPHLHVAINGGVMNLDQTEGHLKFMDAVMIGRAAYQTPYILAQADRRIFGDMQAPVKSRHDIIREFLPYVAREVKDRQVPLHHITRHLMGLFVGQPGGKRFRRFLSENAWHKGQDEKILEQALALVPEEKTGLAL